jgi:hypothetical protein
VEPGMHVPSSVLNEYRDSFKAADEECVKASMKLFADTGLMALFAAMIMFYGSSTCPPQVNANTMFWHCYINSSIIFQNQSTLDYCTILLVSFTVVVSSGTFLEKTSPMLNSVLLSFMLLLIIGPVNLFTILVSAKALVSQMAKAVNIFGVT